MLNKGGMCPGGGISATGKYAFIQYRGQGRIICTPFSAPKKTEVKDGKGVKNWPKGTNIQILANFTTKRMGGGGWAEASLG